ncbi:MAG: chemotaxis protein CheW [Nitrospira sp.]
MDVQESMTGTPSPVSLLRFLIVVVGGRYLALNAKSICGLLTLEETGDVENPTVHGMVYGALNLADRLSLSHDADGANARVVLLSEGNARGNVRVPMVQGLLELQPSQVLPLPLQFRGAERQWYRGVILFANNIALVLNTTWVLNAQVSDLESGGASKCSSVCADLKISVNDSRIC